MAHHIARLRAQLDRASPLERKGLAVQHDDLWKLANKNRHCLVDVVAQSLTRVSSCRERERVFLVLVGTCVIDARAYSVRVVRSDL